MNNQLEVQPTNEIVWPQMGVVEVGPDVDFIYVMRKDADFAMTPIAEQLANDSHKSTESVKGVLLEKYDTFFSKLSEIFIWGYALKGNFQLHIFDPDILDKEIRKKADQLPIVSLDPIMDKGVYQHKVSRGYYLGGKKDFGQVPRPGSESLADQASQISVSLSGMPVCVSEDDIFSGGSIIASLNALLDQGVSIARVLPGIQVGKPKKLTDMGLQVDPVVIYQTTDGKDIFDKLDLGDPRDYLLGASGLVIKLPNNNFGRAPYVPPFVSVTSRAGIPANIEKEFAYKVLQANYMFFKEVEETLSAAPCLKHMDQSFVAYMHDVYGIDPNTEMSVISSWLMDHIDELWENIQKQGEFQEQLAALNLPKNIVFLDVNGTLFSDESKDGYIAYEDIEKLKYCVDQAKQKSISIGLCSDSPLPQLQILAERLGIEGPILAENGNILFHADKTIMIHQLKNIWEFKDEISSIAAAHGYIQTDDCIAPELGGKQIDSQTGQWGFGANREASVTVFGPGPLIEALGQAFSISLEAFSVDCSPEYNFFAIHPGKSYKLNKGLSLNLLSAFGHTVVMVGNSMSDWVEPDGGVMCAFVNGARIHQSVFDKAAYISSKNTIEGVVDILEHCI